MDTRIFVMVALLAAAAVAAQDAGVPEAPRAAGAAASPSLAPRDVLVLGEDVSPIAIPVPPPPPPIPLPVLGWERLDSPDIPPIPLLRMEPSITPEDAYRSGSFE